MARFLFTLWDGGGSLPPELAVVRQVVAAGHTVTVVGDPVIETEVRAAGVTDFRPWVDAPHHDTRRAEDDYIRDWELRSPTRVLANLLDALMLGEASTHVGIEGMAGPHPNEGYRERRATEVPLGDEASQEPEFGEVLGDELALVMMRTIELSETTTAPVAWWW